MNKDWITLRHEVISKVEEALATGKGTAEYLETLGKRLDLMKRIVGKLEQLKLDYGVTFKISLIGDDIVDASNRSFFWDIRVLFLDDSLLDTLKNLNMITDNVEMELSNTSYSMLQEERGSEQRQNLMYKKFSWERRIRSLDRIRVDYPRFVQAYTEAVLFLYDLARQDGVISTVRNNPYSYIGDAVDSVGVRFERDGYKKLRHEESFTTVKLIDYSDAFYEEDFFLISKRSGISDVEEFHEGLRGK